jgi:hypothetical protein
LKRLNYELGEKEALWITVGGNRPGPEYRYFIDDFCTYFQCPVLSVFDPGSTFKFFYVAPNDISQSPQQKLPIYFTVTPITKNMY